MNIFKHSNNGDSEGFTESFYEQAIKLLSEYIQIPTINPPGNDKEGILFLQNIFEQNNLKPTLYETVPDRFALSCSIPGSDPDLKPVVISGHVDVVPADNDGWDVPPFSGQIKDGFIWGRGALDMKNMGIMELMAFLTIFHRDIPLKRGLTYLALPDEEKSGEQGSKIFAEEYLQEINPEFIINEGSYGMKNLMYRGTIFSIAVAEKIEMKLRLTSRGTPSHGNTPGKDSAITKLITGLTRIKKMRYPMTIHPIVRDMFKRVAAQSPVHESIVLKHPDCIILKSLLNRELKKDTTMNALTRTTIAITVLRAGEALNSIPGIAEAFLDVRMLPGTEPDNVTSDIKKCVQGLGIDVDTVHLSVPGKPSSYTSPIFSLIEAVLKEEVPEALVVPTMEVGGTDSKYFRAKGIPCYDLIPCILEPEDLKRIHGENERLSLDNFRFGIRVMYKMLCRLCNADL